MTNAYDEAEYTPMLRQFAKIFNSRMCGARPRINVGSTWVRFVPPDEAELSFSFQDQRYMPFGRVGALGEVTDVSGQYVTFRCGGDSIMYDQQVFLETFIRAVAESEWRR